MDNDQKTTEFENRSQDLQPEKQKKPIYKKWWFWVIVGVVVIAVISSSGNNSPKKEINTKEPNENVSVLTEDESFKLNETAVFKAIKITANKLEESNGTDFFTPDSGNVFVGIEFTIENISDKDQTMSSMLLFDAYVDGVKCEYSVTANCAFSDGTLDGNISPGKKMIGYYAVEVPDDWKEIELQVLSTWLSNSKATFLFSK